MPPSEAKLFFVHVPKCAGMSLMEALVRALNKNYVYQSTSMAQNYWENRAEFFLCPNPRRYRALIGHWLHEDMLPLIGSGVKFASSLRHPVERVRSQFRFDLAMRGGNWPSVSKERFLQANRNVICRFITHPFPTISREFASNLDAAKFILTGMDFLFDVDDADVFQPKILRAIGLNVDSVPKSNVTAGQVQDIDATDEEIAQYCDEDMELYQWFLAAKSIPELAGENNPVYSADGAKTLSDLSLRETDCSAGIDWVAQKYATELKFAIGAKKRNAQYIERMTRFVESLKRAHEG